MESGTRAHFLTHFKRPHADLQVKDRTHADPDEARRLDRYVQTHTIGHNPRIDRGYYVPEWATFSDTVGLYT
jgi:hypothetical protein